MGRLRATVDQSTGAMTVHGAEGRAEREVRRAIIEAAERYVRGVLRGAGPYHVPRIIALMQRLGWGTQTLAAAVREVSGTGVIASRAEGRALTMRMLTALEAHRAEARAEAEANQASKQARRTER